jgi:hypothetical protein
MPDPFTPHLEILAPSQRRLWDELGQIPTEFVLYGGTAVALHLGHRESADFDFFGDRPLDPVRLAPTIPILANAIITQREPDTLSCIVDRGGPVKLSFFGLPALGRLQPARVASGNGLHVASLLDLAATKMAAVQARAEAKDYIDIDALIGEARIDLSRALAGAAAIYGAQFNPQLTLKALSYFGDGNLPQLPQGVRDRLIEAVKAVDLDRLPAGDAVRQ